MSHIDKLSYDVTEDIRELESTKMENRILKDQLLYLNDCLSDYFDDSNDDDEESLGSVIVNYFKSKHEKKYPGYIDPDKSTDLDGEGEDEDDELDITDYISMYANINVYIERLKHEAFSFKLISFIVIVSFIVFILILAFCDIDVYFLSSII